MALPTIYNIELCAGSGMLAEGVRIALSGNMRTIAYVEHEPYAAALLTARIEDKTLVDAPVWDDVHTTTSPDFLCAVAGLRPLLLTGGYPCQPFSVAGKRLGVDDPRHLWPSIDRLIGALEPEYVFFENVAGHLGMGFGAVRGDLERRGYRVSAGIFSAGEVGASHRRERLFIFGSRVANTTGECGDRIAGDICQAQRGSRGALPREHRIASGDVAHTGHRTGCASTPGTEAKRADTPCDGGGILADTGGEGLQGGERGGRIDEEGREIAHGRSSQCSQIPLFAPGPDARDDWEHILADHPELAPAVKSVIYRTPDGVAYSMDKYRLKLTGNGVVPLAVAYAFLSLASVNFSAEGD